MNHADLSPSLRRQRKLYSRETSYHLVNRAVPGERMFLDDVDRREFLRAVRVASERAGVEVLAYSLMSNHYHLVVHQRERERAIEAFMRSAMTSYAMQFNRRHHRTGRLCVERYRAEAKIDARELKQAILYVHANPSQPFEDRWTSHGAYVDPRRRAETPWLAVDAGLRLFAGRAAYLEALHLYLASRD